MLGDPLFVKVQGRLEPTTQALSMWPRLKAALAELDSTLAGSSQFDPAQARDDFHIGCNGSVELTLSAWMAGRSEEHTSELQSLMRISYAVFCLKKKKHTPLHK